MNTDEPVTRYSDEWLAWAAQNSPSRGDRNTANMLREIPFEHRQRAAGLAHAIMNRVAINYSGAMWNAISELMNANYGETVTERQNREWCEQDKARREAKWEAEVRAFNRSQGVTGRRLAERWATDGPIFRVLHACDREGEARKS